MSRPHQPNRMRHDAAPPETTLPEVAIRKADRLSVTACCEAPRACLAFGVVSASIRTASTRDASVHSSRATGRLTPHRK
jgi:hypothetical protein